MFEYTIVVRKNGTEIKRIELKGFSGNAAMDELKHLKWGKYKPELGYEVTLE
jgi:hypothetical protein